MKLRPSFLILSLAALLGAANPARADVLSRENITITGTIEQQVENGATSTPKRQITIARILALLGITDQNAADLRYFYDSDTNAIVLAAKTVQDGDDVAPVATVVTFSDPTAKVTYNANRSTRVANVTLLNGALPGISYGIYTYARPVETDTNRITAAGTINSIPTILKLVVEEKSKITAL